jgi:arginine/ornithine transport system substrate-binding protein
MTAGHLTARRRLLATIATIATATAAAALALAALAPTRAAAADAAGPEALLRIGVEGAYPPFSEVGPDGQLHGFDIDIARGLCRELAVRCVLVQQEFDGMIPALQARKFDAIVASMSITPERQRSVAFSDKYYKTPNRLVVRTADHLDPTPAGLKGRRIGVQRASVNDRFATATFPGAEIVRYAKQQDIYLDLAAGRLDATLVDAVAANTGFLATPQGKGFAFAGPPYTDPAYFGAGVGVAMRLDDTRLRERINRAIAAMRANGSYQAIASRYFDFDIYGASR